MTTAATTLITRGLGPRIGILVFSWLALVGVGGILQPTDATWIIILGIYSIGVGCLLVVGTGWVSLALILGFALRLLLLWMDLYTEIQLFSSGGDTENFYNTALSIYNNPSLFGSDLYGGLFPQLCGALFWLIGPSRLFVQYANLIFGIVAFMFIGLSMKEMKVPERVSKGVLLICCVMPIPAIISVLFLRESLIFCLVAASFYAFTRWLRRGSAVAMFLALALIAAAASFHLGVLGLAGGYGFALLFYDRQSARFSFSISNLLRGLPIVLIAAFVIGRFPGIFLEKLEKVSSAEDAIAIATGSSGASAYLTGIQIDNPVSFVLFGGLKGLFLLVSPLPMDWRGLNDVLSFGVDGVFYLAAILVVLRSFVGRQRSYRRRLLNVVMVGLVTAVLILGLGTSAAGTAMRHRQKVLPVIAVAVGLALTVQRERKGSIERYPLPNAEIEASPK